MFIRGRYRLDSLLGKGGMSEVWRAEDQELERRVALKLLAPDADRARFDREARAAAALAHPNITQLYDYGEAEGRPYMVLEYLPGGTLESRLASGRPLPDEDTERIAAELAAGLAHAHARGLVHRDLKPANVLFDAEGRAKIADFGIARLGAGGTLTEAGTVLGTAAYISPEQAAGEPASPASDVYSFGVILFRMLTGRLPFEAEQPMDLVAMHRHEAPPPLEWFRDDPPPSLAALVSAALAKDPGARPQDGRALLDALGVVPTASSAVPVAEDADVTQVLAASAPPPPSHRRRRSAAAIAAVLALLAAGGIAVAFALTQTKTPAVDTSSPLPTIAKRTLPELKTATTASVVTAAPPASTAPTTTERKKPKPPTTAPAATTLAPTTVPLPTTEPPPTTVDTATLPPPTASVAGTTTGLRPK